MNSMYFIPPTLAASCLVLGLLAVFLRRRRTPRARGFIEVSPRYRSFFRRQGLIDADHFLALPGETPHIVSGHPDRQVARVSFVSGRRRWLAFLKIEHCVTWRARLGNALAGFGLLSRSVREARTLQSLEREGHCGPEWLAAGEDGQGRAFLLVREEAGIELRVVLRAETDSARRREIARNLGVAIARLHTAGFRHPDLYANHFLVDPLDDTIRILDWQRSRLMRALSWPDRQRDLAALHATVDDALATPRERLACLQAYRRASRSLGVSWRIAARGIEEQARHLLKRRHIREKRQPPSHTQAWICLQDEALWITPVMRQRCPDRVPDWLASEAETPSSAGPMTRRWPTLLGESRALLVRRNERKPLAELWRRFRRGSFDSPEQRQASLLLRLQRHAIAAPQVLALGQRRDPGGRIESFLLTEPLTDTCGLEAWLARRTRRRSTATGQVRRWAVLRQAGALLHRLHEANCYLDIRPSGCGLAVREATLVLNGVEAVVPCRRRQPKRARRDVARLQQVLRAAGCSRTDLCRFRAGYRGENGEPRRAPSAGAGENVMRAESVSESSASGRDSLWRRLVHGARRLCQRPDWQHFAGSDWADRIMDVDVTDRFHAKQGRSTGRWILHSADENGPARRLSVYLKRHYELPWWQGLLAALWPGRGWSPALQEWQHLEWARQQGVPVPEVVAAAEYIGPWGRLRSFLAVEELTGMLPLHEAIPLAAVRQDAASFRRWKRALVAEMARLARMLHDRRCFHKDLYLCHFYIERDDTQAIPADGWRGRVFLIDLHRLTHHPLTWQIWQTKDLAQLLYSSEIVGVDARDRLCFWREYRGTGPRRRGGRWLRRFVLLKWRRYRQHNARNQQRRRDALESV